MAMELEVEGDAESDLDVTSSADQYVTAPWADVMQSKH
jgi:hypothetical protein